MVTDSGTHQRELEEKIKKFEPPEVPRRQLSQQEIAEVRRKNMEYFHRQKELAKLQARLKRAEAKNKELQVRYGNRPDQRRPRTAVY